MRNARQSWFQCCGSRNRSIQISNSQILECESTKPRVFNCNATVESIWVKIQDKRAQEIYAPCTSFFGNKYANVM